MAEVGILAQDVDDIVSRLNENWLKFSGKAVLVTGASGLVGSLLVRVFLALNKKKHANIKILLLARSERNIKELLGDDIEDGATIYYQSDITDYLDIPCGVDYIVHAAAPANSKYYTKDPVGTVDAIVNGSRRMLDLAKDKKVKKIVLMSSMEAYGVCGDNKVKEDAQGYVDLRNVRNSYAVGKRTAEFLSYAYFKEYGVPSVSVRLAMCFGAGQKVDDPRVHRVFCETALNGRDVEMKSTGKAKINFVYSADAILAILLLLAVGEDGETYNVASDALGYNMFDMAQYIANKNGVKVKCGAVSSERNRITTDDFMILDTEKMLALGWNPKYNIEEALTRYMEYLRQS